jgi:hypothetical protein
MEVDFGSVGSPLKNGATKPPKLAFYSTWQNPSVNTSKAPDILISLERQDGYGPKNLT